MLHYMIGGTLVTLISSNLVNSLVSSTIELLGSSASFIRHGTDSNKKIQKIRNQIEEMDIKIKLELVRTLLETLSKNDVNTIIENGLIDLISKIKSIVEWIDFEIDKHSFKWFSSYRSISIDEKLEQLQHFVKILDSRLQLLLNTSSYFTNKINTHIQCNELD
jgi:Na+/phosphate symporter